MKKYKQIINTVDFHILNIILQKLVYFFKGIFFRNKSRLLYG